MTKLMNFFDLIFGLFIIDIYEQDKKVLQKSGYTQKEIDVITVRNGACRFI